MNQFHLLDSLFPVLPNRVSGEVVCIQVNLRKQGLPFHAFSDRKCVLCHKRKAWYVNSSTNAWHLHRELCRQAREDFGDTLTTRELSKLKIALADATEACYRHNFEFDTQYFELDLNLNGGEWAIGLSESSPERESFQSILLSTISARVFSRRGLPTP